jgi:hypothetical protein
MQVYIEIDSNDDKAEETKSLLVSEIAAKFGKKVKDIHVTVVEKNTVNTELNNDETDSGVDPEDTPEVMINKMWIEPENGGISVLVNVTDIAGVDHTVKLNETWLEEHFPSGQLAYTFEKNVANYVAYGQVRQIRFHQYPAGVHYESFNDNLEVLNEYYKHPAKDHIVHVTKSFVVSSVALLQRINNPDRLFLDVSIESDLTVRVLEIDLPDITVYDLATIEGSELAIGYTAKSITVAVYGKGQYNIEFTLNTETDSMEHTLEWIPFESVVNTEQQAPSEPAVLTPVKFTQFLQDIKKEQATITQAVAQLHQLVIKDQVTNLDDMMERTYEAGVAQLPDPNYAYALREKTARTFAVLAYMTQLPISFDKILLDDISTGAIRALMLVQDDLKAQDLKAQEEAQLAEFEANAKAEQKEELLH